MPLIILDRDQHRALSRLADPINANGLWFNRQEIPKPLEKLIADGLIARIDADQRDACFQITQSGINYWRSYLAQKGVS